jgi:hypothetical protein
MIFLISIFYLLHIRSVCHNSKFWTALIYTILSNMGGAVCVLAKSIVCGNTIIGFPTCLHIACITGTARYADGGNCFPSRCRTVDSGTVDVSRDGVVCRGS